MLNAVRELIDWAPLGLPSWLFLITVVVFFHELGHFSVARLFGVRVETFSIGFGPEMFGWTDKRGTRWKISWLPLGGYVKFFGDADAASRPDREAGESMSADERKVSLLHKPLYQRALVVAAGPVANFILAIVIFTAMFLAFGRMVIEPRIGAVDRGSPAEAAGIRADDVIRKIDGTDLTDFNQLREIVALSASQELAITLDRGGALVTVHATPKIVRRPDLFGTMENLPTLGVHPSANAGKTVIHYGVVAAIGAAVGQTWDIVTDTLKGLGQIVTGRSDASQLRGPVGTAGLAKKVAGLGFLALIQLAALLSVSIGLINLFPIPVLDGGHLLYYACEGVLGHPLGERAQDVGFRFGMALVLGLVLFVTWNDLIR
jgi:regulator of sigma E protease